MNFILNQADIIKSRDTLNKEFRAIRERKGDTYVKGNSPEDTKKGCLQ